MQRGNYNGVNIWAIGGGKGGTGKSLFTSLLGMYLASTGKKIILMDADFGGANLHSFVDIKKTGCTLTDFFVKKIPLSDVVRETPIGNLRLIPGDLYAFNPRGFNYMQKQRLFRNIKKLDADLVLMDLGAGSGTNTVDAFLQADRMIVLATPQTITIENLYLFMNKVLFRKLHTELDRYGLKTLAEEAWKQRGEVNLKSIRDVVRFFSTFSDRIKWVMEKELSDFSLNVVMNQVRNTQQMQMGISLKNVMSSYYGIWVRYMGHIRYNEFLWKYNNRFYSLFGCRPLLSTLREVEAIARRLVEGEKERESRQTVECIV